MSDWMRDRAALHCQNYAFTSEGSIRDLIEECYQRGLAERALTASAPAGEPSKTHCSECGVSRYGNHVQWPGEHYPRCSKFKAPAGEQEKTSASRLSPADASTACARCGILGTLHGATPPHTRGDTCVGFLAASALGIDPSKEHG